MTPFVKIGLVTAPRVSAERLIEHQTANPRRLTIPDGWCIKTDAVSMVEAQLHRRLGKFRVGGEWFKFTNDEDLALALDTARQLSEDAKSLTSLIQEAELLEQEPSSQLTVPSTEELNREADLLDCNKKALTQLIEIKDAAKEFFSNMSDSGKEVESVARVRSVTYKPKFLQDVFAAEYPEIFKKYLFEESSMVQRFQLKPRTYEISGADLEFANEIAQIEKLIEMSILSKSIESMTEPLISVERLLGLVTWNIEISISKLKVACGRAEGIEGVCTWKRANKVKEVFDTPSFLSDHPELYKSYLSDEITKEYFLPSNGSRRK